MKKISIIIFLIFTFIQTVSSMLPGPPIAVQCPNCGEAKQLLSLSSGNTLRQKTWSDLYQHAPMLPRLSPIQKCPKCHSYFFLSRASRMETNDDDYSMETGRLSFPEMKEAMNQLLTDSLSKNEVITLRREFLHRFNDCYRGENPNEPKPEDLKLNQSNILALIPLIDKSDAESALFLAELHREAGNFNECISILESFNSQYAFLNTVADQIRTHAKNSDPSIFLLTP